MTPGLKEALKRRSQQWSAFNAWERDRAVTDIPLHERVSWYVSAYNLAQTLSSSPTSKDIEDKAAHLRQLGARLKHLSRGNRNV